MASHVFAELKWRDINAELASEFAKDLVWEGRYKTLENQVYVLGKQYHRIERLSDKVDVIVTDSPILFSSFYKPENLSDNFDKLVFELHYKYNNLNLFVQRRKKYNPKGRVQTKEESMLLDEKVLDFLNKNNVSYSTVEGKKEEVEKVADMVEEARRGLC